jgi:hypothetical protein
MLYLSLLKFIRVDGVLGLYWEFFFRDLFREFVVFCGCCFLGFYLVLF